MKKITQITLSTIIALSFTACGSSNTEEVVPTPTPIVEITPTPTPTPAPMATIIELEECTDPAVIESYTVMLTGDSIIDVSGDAVVTTYHNQEDVKSICLGSGEAHISRPPSS